LWTTIRNLLLTMALSGLWHGAGWTFLVWGLIHGVYLALYHSLRHAVPRVAAAVSTGRLQGIGWLVTFAITTIAWVYFRAGHVADANAMVGNMFGVSPGTLAVPLSWYGIALALLILHRAEAWWIAHADAITDRAGDAWMRIPGPVQALAAFPVLVFLVAITKVVHGAFIYFQF
jgi:D-alanyl-lipoteichoic acid acyltransferase DltB (MBOAT superfamily)